MRSDTTTAVPQRASPPRLFVWAGKPRTLWALAAMTLISGAAMLPAMSTMSDHGASLIAFEDAGTAARSEEILAAWGDPGKAAAWWQLALDTPFLVGYGLFAAGACAAVARRAVGVGKPRLVRAAALVAWCGPLAAGADFLQNVSLALILSGRVAQPWPRIAAVCGPATTTLMAVALLFALAGAIVTRERRAARGTAGSDA
jgi:hypothetical protein